MQNFVLGYGSRTWYKYKYDTLIKMELSLIMMAKICRDYGKINEFKNRFLYQRIIMAIFLHILFSFSY